MFKAFGWTLLFWSLFIITNTVADAINFYAVFPLYKDMTVWHWLKVFWMLWLFLTGFFANKLFDLINYEYVCLNKRRWPKRIGFTISLLVWFLLLRWGLHEFLMYIWRQ